MLQHFLFSGRDQQKAAFREHLAPEISESSLFFFRREARESAEVMTKLSFADMEGTALLHRARPSAVLKRSSSRAVPDPVEAVRQVTALSPAFPPPARSPCRGVRDATE